MRCPSPISVKQKIGPRVQVPCGKCIFCIKTRMDEWVIRLTKELRYSHNAWFVTLTYNEGHVPVVERPESGVYEGSLRTKDVQAFVKRLRAHKSELIDDYLKKTKVQHVPREIAEQRKLRYYVIGEYGPTTKRPHYHGVFFNVPRSMIDAGIINRAWCQMVNGVPEPMGFVSCYPAREGALAYMVKYMMKVSEWNQEDPREKPKALMSRNPGIGKQYIETVEGWHRANRFFFVLEKGKYRKRMPRYYRDQVFTKFEKDVQNAKWQKEEEERIEKEMEECDAQGINFYEREILRIENERRRLEKQMNNHKRNSI